jgi:methyl-accepting chemotaxis protein
MGEGMEIKRNRRHVTSYLVNRDVQLKMLSINLAYVLVIIFLTLLILLAPLFHDMFMSGDADVRYMATQSFFVLIKYLVPAVGIMFFLSLAHQIVFSHRILGPLVNFSHTFERMAEGDLTRKVFVRKGDYLWKESQRINAMIDSLSGIMAGIRSRHEKLLSLIEQSVSKTDTINDDRKLEEHLMLLKREALLVQEGLSIFKIADDEGKLRSGQGKGQDVTK